MIRLFNHSILFSLLVFFPKCVLELSSLLRFIFIYVTYQFVDLILDNSIKHFETILDILLFWLWIWLPFKVSPQFFKLVVKFSVFMLWSSENKLHSSDLHLPFKILFTFHPFFIAFRCFNLNFDWFFHDFFKVWSLFFK